MKDGKEELKDIESEIRARALAWLDEGMTRYDLRLADRIAEARERERNRQYKPRCDWSIRDARALANTLANHGLRDGNADAASSCIYSLCRILSSLGNAAAIREALIKIYHEIRSYCYDYGAGESHTSLIDRIMDSPPDYTSYEESILEIDSIVESALAASPRNCDRFGSYEDALDYWREHVECAEDNGSFDVWLMARAEGGAE